MTVVGQTQTVISAEQEAADLVALTEAWWNVQDRALNYWAQGDFQMFMVLSACAADMYTEAVLPFQQALL